MATKKEMVKELMGLGSINESKSDLEKMTNKQLEEMIIDYSPASDEVEESQEPEVNQSDSLMKQMQEQMALMMKQMESLKVENESLKVESKEVQVEDKTIPKKVTQVDKDKLIPIMNITAHSLIYLSKRTGAEWNWEQYGDIEYMEMAELLTMRNAHRRFLDEPFILIMDDDAVNYLGLEKMYEKMISPDNIDKVFKMKMDNFKEVINSSPKGIQILIANRAKQLIDNGELDSMAKINFINEIFNTDLGL
jgi:hypothetical protein